MYREGKKELVQRLKNRAMKEINKVTGIISYIGYDRDYRYILLSIGIGDIVWFGTFFPVFKEKFKTRKIKVITFAKFEAITKMFIDECDVISVNKKRYESLKSYANKLFFKKISYGQIDDSDISIRCRGVSIVVDRSVFLKRNNQILERTGIEMDILYKYGYFNLEKDDKPRRLHISDEIKSVSRNYMNEIGIKENYILIVPTANSRTILPDEFWRNMIKLFMDSGYDVFVNGNEERFKDIANVIMPPIEYMPVIGLEACMVVGARCGLMDLIYVSSADISVIHNIDSADKTMYQYYAGKYESFEEIEERCSFGNDIVMDFRVDVSNDDVIERSRKIAIKIIEQLDAKSNHNVF